MKSILFIFCFLPSSLLAMTVSDVQKKMQASAETVQSLQFQYVQELRSLQSAESRVSTGTVFYKKPKWMRIEHSNTENQITITQGKVVYIVTPRFNQVVQQSWDDWFQKNFWSLGLADFSPLLEKAMKEYNWSLLENKEFQGEKMIRIALKNRTDPEGTPAITLWISPSDYLLRKTELVSGSLIWSTTIHAVVRNSDLKESLFQFKVPPNSKVIQIH
ncbi:MAG: outer membrane lipoprotein carrier protein LolA [Elusimicrobia bacterium]|nr:outer membrane lipoprotein carrier protein LolA [Elusimicrobiota bacterium]